jgi:hypothetical protein
MSSPFRRNPYIPVLKPVDGLVFGGAIALGAFLVSQMWEFGAVALVALVSWYVVKTQENLMWQRYIRKLEAEVKKRSPESI